MHAGEKQSDCSFWLQNSQEVLVRFSEHILLLPPPTDVLSSWSLSYQLIPVQQLTCDCTDWL